MKLASLFDGSGGFPLGGILAGITPVWASEIEPYPIRVTTKRLPYMRHCGDVSAINGANVEPVDIITFGSPCQDMSVAGKRAGLDGYRSGLFYQATRIIKEMRRNTNGKYPRWAVWENVPGAFSSNKGEDFKAVLEELISITGSEQGSAFTIPTPPKRKWDSAGLILGNGFSIAWRQLDAQYWGVPQRRKRIFLVADFAGQCAGDVLFESEGLSGYTPQGFRAWERTACDTARSAGDTGGCLVFENHGQDCRYTEMGTVCETFAAKYGTGGNNTPLVCLNDQGGESIGFDEELSPTLRSEAHGNMPCVIEPKTLKIRSGCEGGGKGALIQNNKSGTLSCNNDQTLFQPAYCLDRAFYNQGKNASYKPQIDEELSQTIVAKGPNAVAASVVYGICAKDSNSMKSDNPHSGIYEADTSRTIDANGGNPSCNQGGMVVIQGSMIGREAKNGPQGSGINEDDVSFTLNTADRHAVAYKPYAMSKDSHYTRCEKDDLANCLYATDYKVPQLVLSRQYIVRRLTPTECARLQGFPDWWCSDLETEDPSDDELRFWRGVFDTYSAIMGVKPKTDKQILKWLKSPHTDGAEYKMWGNGVALPCVYFVLSGIVWANGKEQNDE